MKSAQAIATYLKISGLRDYDVIPPNNPIHFDGFSCGVFVCWMFIRQVTAGPPQDMSAPSLPRRRSELFYYLLRGQLLPFQVSGNDDKLEEKMPVPKTLEGLTEDEEVSSTQLAL
ncbi:hypothetical protein F441_22697 [Phytophthora nicotianae CJ01A1]|uniref:Ubiquitin-like protease family profile domain-containing protein n=3 Tax=Phytophthora nicotianae TaxID=4792 RepID=W2XZC5_PHYNI|nr:hypothetical protein L916_02632 [Phytophthora nicotianae]ETO99879.1 hypothetical protein F441_22697 [Phytophthora nicotianae CJ01A1]ETP28076.1 hypothetical protein F442_22640 [Phytophthora nicotianae P10297]